MRYKLGQCQKLNQEIVCSKICKNIIGSTFCIAILTEVTPKSSDGKPSEGNNNSLKWPNAKVYFEYGMMTALNKDIIPLQKKGQDLNFDIRNLDLVLYDEINQANIEEFKESIRKGIMNTKDSSVVNAVAQKYYKNMEEELKKNYGTMLSYRGMIRSLDNEYVWYEAHDIFNSIMFVVFEMLKRRGALLEFDKEKEIAECYENLEYFTRYFNAKMRRFLDYSKNPNLTDDQKKYFGYRLCEDLEKKYYNCIEKVEKTLILINEDNRIYIKQMKGA